MRLALQLLCAVLAGAWALLSALAPLPPLAAPKLLARDACRDSPALDWDLVSPVGFALSKARLLIFNPSVPWTNVQVSLVAVARPDVESESRSLARLIVSSRAFGYRSIVVVGREPEAREFNDIQLLARRVQSLASEYDEDLTVVATLTLDVLLERPPETLVDNIKQAVLFHLDADKRVKVVAGPAGKVAQWLESHDASSWSALSPSTWYRTNGDKTPAPMNLAGLRVFEPSQRSEYCITYARQILYRVKPHTTQRNERQQAIAGAIAHAWRSYVKHAGDSDDLQPLSRTGNHWLFARATYYDSLDTLWLAGLHDDFFGALPALSVPYPYNPTKNSKSFEYSIRVVGGLLGAYTVTGHPLLLDGAQRAAQALLEGPFAFSPTPLPRMYNVLVPPNRPVLHAYASVWNLVRNSLGEHRYNSLAGVGSYSLEFHALSKETGRPVFGYVADAIQSTLVPDPEHREPPWVSQVWDTLEGSPLPVVPSFGSGADSFYEYQLKTPLLVGASPTGLNQRILYGRVVDQLPVLRLDSGAAYVAGLATHLQCFWPGVLALGSIRLPERATDLDFAKELLAGCTALYDVSSLVKLGPEEAILGGVDNQELILENEAKAGYLLRPEYVESLYVMWEATGDHEYRELAWKVFEHIERFCRTEDGYASLSNVLSGFKLNDQPSYFIAETLKYLYLIQSPRDAVVPFNKVVYTTEAHPVQVGPPICVDDNGKSPCLQVFAWQERWLEAGWLPEIASVVFLWYLGEGIGRCCCSRGKKALVVKAAKKLE